MKEQFGPDPLEELRAADPVHADRLSSASLARIRARVSEDVMTTAASPPSWLARNVRLGARAGLVAVSALALVVAIGGRGAAPDGQGAPGTAACVEPYSTTAIANRTFAFDGTVTAIDGEQVTFAVGTAYRGVAGGTITLDAPGMTGAIITSADGPKLIVGERYLVAGDAHFVWACGYTQPYDAAVADEWAAALGG